jgi:hypothetical protein
MVSKGREHFRPSEGVRNSPSPVLPLAKKMTIGQEKQEIRKQQFLSVESTRRKSFDVAVVPL